ncbi:MAG: hypothetical protein CVU63_11295, partial [Deltaproteobacteria bacterium HGW-Deltaproteobacteria-20]
MLALFLACFFLLASFASRGAAATYYVKSGDLGGNDGNSGADWDNAFATFGHAIQSAVSSGDVVRVAKGTYETSTGTTGFTVSNSGVSFYGGYPENGGIEDERDPASNATTLRPAGGTTARVITINDNTTDILIDGFVITGGNPPEGNDGGGIYNKSGASLTVTRSTISENTVQNKGGTGNGGGICNRGTLALEACTISGNRAEQVNASPYGGGICNLGTLTLDGCTLSGNIAERGGGIHVYLGSLTATNCTFSGNNTDLFGTESHSNDGQGGGVFNNLLTTSTFLHCTFKGNSGANDGKTKGIYNRGSVTVKNSIFWGGTGASQLGGAGQTVSYCVVEGGYDGGTNILTNDPLLGNLADNGGPTRTCALGAGSPAIDAGTDVGAAATDQRGAARPQPAGGAYDMGA